MGRTDLKRKQAENWDPADLTTRLCNILDIAARAVRTLAPRGYSDPDDVASGVEAEKVVSETGLLLLACKPLAREHIEVWQRVQTVARLLIPHARNDRVRLALCMRPGVARDYTFAHACLSQLGYPDPEVDRLLQLSLEAEVAGGSSSLPGWVLEQDWIRRVWDPGQDHPRADAGLGASFILGRSMSVFTATRDDIYTFTHAIMYLTDLGERRVRLPRSRAETIASAEAALARCLDQQDYDLCGELLLTWPYLGERWSALATFAFRVLARVEDEAGFLPAPLTRLDRYYSLSGDERSHYAMATVYHTVYVMGLVCAAALRPGKAPPLKILHSRRSRGAEVLIEFIDSDDSHPHWRDNMSKLDRRERESLAPMLLTIALGRAVERRDFQRVRTLLECSLKFGLVTHPAPRQAAGLLRRLAATSAAGSAWQ